ncbi:MAG: DUF4209 domain-containing protein [Treponema sp.]|nr:DUF4209 domain-containing protein [Treponema sp.]
MERSDKEIDISLLDYQNLLNCCPILSNTTIKYNELQKQLFLEAQKSEDEKYSYILWLLADISEIAYSKEGKQVFSPKWNLYGNARSMIPEDLSEKNIDFLKSIYDFIVNKMLRAKIADILWEKKIKPKNIAYANYVIEVYLELPFSDHKTFYSNQIYLKRALSLANGMKKREIISDFENKIFKTFVEYEYDGFAYLFQLTDFMIETLLCNSKAKEISDKLNDFGEKCENDNSFNLAGSYFARAAIWANKFDENRALEYQAKNAKASIHHAEFVSKDDKAGISETAYYEEALKILRSIKRENRRLYFSEAEEKEIADKIREAGQKCIANMGGFSIPINLSECVKQITNHIVGKTKEEALRFLSLLDAHISYEEIKENSITMLKHSALFSFIPKQFYGDDGRIVARTKGYDLKSQLSDDDENVIQWMMFEYQNYIQIHVVGAILPALQVFTNEHNFSFRELNEIVNKSTIFPNNRKGIITKGLMAGFEYDFITALHLLVPQVENMVRYQLRLANVKTSGIDKDGIETENGLSTLVKNPEFDSIFGKDLGFEIKALLCNSFGSNLRNNVAHGLLDMNQMQSHSVIYFWWLCLRLVYIEFWNSYRQE